MRKPIITANWKMYKTRGEALAFCQQLLPLIEQNKVVQAVICAPFTQLDILADRLLPMGIGVGAQNFYPKKEGAFTGEVSLAMLKDMGVGYVIIGHSERRALFGEDNDLIKEKLEAAFEAGVQPILCVGETDAQREAGQTAVVCKAQLAYAISELSEEKIQQLVVAYEPIWAIGTGKTATAEDAETVIGGLRAFLANTHGAGVAESVRFQYGGSVKPDNIASFMAQPNIDGALVGGASLDAGSFAQLVNYQHEDAPKPVVLMVLDGWGLGKDDLGNAIRWTNTPHYDALMAKYPNGRLRCSGEDVGLPEGQQGNSEVGHLNLGAGRVVYQELTRINKAVREHEFEKNPIFNQLMERTLAKGQNLHLMGLISPGGVHSHTDHLLALVKLAKAKGFGQVYIHGFLDGRDVAPKSGLGYVQALNHELDSLGLGEIVTLCGRYYGMDRDNRWERIATAYHGMTQGLGDQVDDLPTAIQKAYDQGLSDEFIQPMILLDEEKKAKGRIEPGDGLIFFNFRADRAREMTKAFCEADFKGFARAYLQVDMATMTGYEEGLGVVVAYPPQYLANTLGEVLAKEGLGQFRLAETEKYAHVTFFFNGGVEKTNDLEERLLVASPMVATYDLQPEMSAAQVTAQLLKALEKKRYAFILVNFANPDMVGHTGNFEAAKKAVACVDRHLGEIAKEVEACGGVLLVTADHGNVEQMIDLEKHEPFTAHTANEVPFLVVGKAKCQVQSGTLRDVAPTILDLLQIEKPIEMTGQSLIQYS